MICGTSIEILMAATNAYRKVVRWLLGEVEPFIEGDIHA